MNDCIYYCLDICNSSACVDCPNYVQAHSPYSHKIVQEYQKDIEHAIDLVAARWKEKLNYGEI